MEKYVITGWPESQKFERKKGCISAVTANPTDPDDADSIVLVPEKVYLRSQGKDAPTRALLDQFHDLRARLQRFISDNVPEKGIKLTEQEIKEEELRVDFCDHHTGDLSRITVTKINRFNIEGKDDYGFDCDRVSTESDLDVNALYDIVHFLYYKRNKTKVFTE